MAKTMVAGFKRLPQRAYPGVKASLVARHETVIRQLEHMSLGS
jgi:hypothetical protein